MMENDDGDAALLLHLGVRNPVTGRVLTPGDLNSDETAVHPFEILLPMLDNAEYELVAHTGDHQWRLLRLA